MDPLHDFFEMLPEEQLSKLPVNVYRVKEGGSRELKLVKNEIYKSNQFVCEAYYKPITLIIDAELLKLRPTNGET